MHRRGHRGTLIDEVAQLEWIAGQIVKLAARSLDEFEARIAQRAQWIAAEASLIERFGLGLALNLEPPTVNHLHQTESV